jgi:hypothetical protein
MGKNKEPIIVYWAPEASLEKEHQQVMLENSLKPVILDIQKRRNKEYFGKSDNSEDSLGNFYHMCTALHELTKNLFYIKAPFDVNVEFDEYGKIKDGQMYSRWFINRLTSLQGGVSADFNINFMFFCEESLKVSITPPYLHQTSQPEYGFVSSVKWDIGSWFRPFIVIYQLWENKSSIYFKQDEPIAYLKFETDREIIFKEYMVNETILKIADSCLKHKFILPFESLDRLYSRFTQTSLKKRLLHEIKSNLV